MARSNISVISTSITNTEVTSLFEGNKTVTTTTYTLLEGDNGYVIYMDNASTITVTLPAGLPSGFNCTVVKQNVGNVLFVNDGTSSIEANTSDLLLQYEAGTIYHKGSNVFNIFG